MAYETHGKLLLNLINRTVIHTSCSSLIMLSHERKERKFVPRALLLILDKDRIKLPKTFNLQANELADLQRNQFKHLLNVSR